MNIVSALPCSSSTAGMHGLAVQLPELEDVAHLDAARDLERAAAARARDRRFCTLRMSTECGSARSRPQFTPRKCMSFSLAPQTKSARVSRRMIDVHRAGEADRAR